MMSMITVTAVILLVVVINNEEKDRGGIRIDVSDIVSL